MGPTNRTITSIYIHDLMHSYTVFLNCINDDALSKVSSLGKSKMKPGKQRKPRVTKFLDKELTTTTTSGNTP